MTQYYIREIEFKAKSLADDRWVHGYYVKHERPSIPIGDNPYKDRHYIAKTGFADWNLDRPIDMIEVDQKTVSQYTNFTDKNDTRIYDSDRVKLSDGKVYTVCWNEGGGYYDLAHEDDEEMIEDRILSHCIYHGLGDCELVGNIWDELDELKESPTTNN